MLDDASLLACAGVIAVEVAALVVSSSVEFGSLPGPLDIGSNVRHVIGEEFLQLRHLRQLLCAVGSVAADSAPKDV